MVENLASELALMGFSTTVILPFYKYDINGNKLNLDNFDMVEKTKHEVRTPNNTRLSSIMASFLLLYTRPTCKSKLVII